MSLIAQRYSIRTNYKMIDRGLDSCEEKLNTSREIQLFSRFPRVYVLGKIRCQVEFVLPRLHW